MECDDDANANSTSLACLKYTKSSLLANIQCEVEAMNADVKTELNAFHHTLREDVNNDLSEFRHVTNQALGDITEDLKTKTTT